ncbi:acyl-CoA thioesterase-1 [Aliiroseovarius sediminilitoris]|uniref:Acyl-CoA thioesterase-1 n=1 Tax=Aliiroseovarius sediminilitoris TaxID=1173584 RepID=A0A1I0NKQ2_9RHOB|nr:arylesterase [Aliiroseovarius sediminilitoris]SEW01826.1 acyl-CoA thioesterase-1 [Aliiroseovarius sediminilitoris]
MVISRGYGVLTRFLKCLAAIVLLSGTARASDVTILAFGDSLTAGYGLPQQDGFVPQLEAWLNDRGADATIINGGVSGDTTAGGAARLGWVLTDDIDVVLVALGANDMLRGTDPQTTYANLDAILSELSARDLPCLLIGMPGPANFGAEYKTEFEQVFKRLAQEHDIPLYPSFLAGLTDAAGSANGALQYLQEDGLHPTAQGVSLIVDALGPVVLDILP